MKTIFHPELGELTFEPTPVGAWRNGSIALSAFQSDLSSSDSSVAAKPPAISAVPLHIHILDLQSVDRSDYWPSPSQVAAVQLLLTHQVFIATAVFAALFKFCHEELLDAVCSRREESELEHARSADNFPGTIRLQSAHVLPDKQSDAADVGLVFESDLWEPEHGLAVLLSNLHIVAVGCADLVPYE